MFSENIAHCYAIYWDYSQREDGGYSHPSPTAKPYDTPEIFEFKQNGTADITC